MESTVKTAADLKTVLIVEDEALIALSTRLLLQQNGFAARIASTGEEAVRLSCSDERIDLILMDIDLGRGISGTTAAQQILAERYIPILFCSSHAEAAVVSQTEQITSYGYVLKTSGAAVLLASIRMAFRLSAANRNYRRLFKNSISGIVVYRAVRDASGEIVDFEHLEVNDAFVRGNGMQRDQLVGQTVRALFPTAAADEVIATFNRAIGAAAGQSIEFFLEPLQHWYRLRGYPMDDDCCAIVGENITTRRREREEFVRQRSLLEALVDSIPDLIFYKDVNGVYLGCNREFARYAGYPREEILNKTDAELFAPEIAAAYRENDQRMIAEMRPRHNEEWIEYPDGRSVLLDTLKTPYWGPNEEFIGVIGISRDITARHQAEADYRRLVDNSPAVLYRFSDRRGAIFLSRQAETLFGHSVEYMLANPFLWNESIHPEDVPAVAAVIAAAPQQEFQVDYRVRHANGEWRWVSDRSIRRRLEDGETIIEGLATDITERKLAEDHIRALLREKELLLRETHHRIKNSFAVAEASIHIQAETSPNLQTAAALRAAQARIATIRVMYERLLQSEGYREVAARTYLCELGAMVLTAYGAEQRIALHAEIADVALPSARIFPVGGIVVELITNCIKHGWPAGRSGSIRLGLMQCAETIELTVQDDGVGLPPGFDLSAAQSYGLLVVRMLSEQIGGTLSCGAAPGGGSVATVRFPA